MGLPNVFFRSEILIVEKIKYFNARECIYDFYNFQIVSRKGKIEERRPLLILFSEDAMRCIFQSADTNENKNYQFLKKLTRVSYFTELYMLQGMLQLSYCNFKTCV